MASVKRVNSGCGGAPSELSLADVICPICLSILIEPVTMPCSHSLCMPCFNQHVTQTSLACPVCRKRISIWVRQSTKAKRLVNTRLWQKIRDNFASKVEARIHGDDESDSEVLVPVHHVSAPGEIRQEYEALLADELQEAAEKRYEEEILSNKLIQQLQDEEKMQLRERRKQQEHLEKNDAVVAQEMKEAEKMFLQEQLTKLQQLCASDEAVARQIEKEEQKEQQLKKRVTGPLGILSKLGQTSKKSVGTPYGPMDVFIDRKMTTSPVMCQDVSNTVSISGNSTTASKSLAFPVLPDCTSDNTDSRSGRQLREITSQSSESEPEDAASAPWLSNHRYLKIPGKENMFEQRRNSPFKPGKKGKSKDCRTRNNNFQCSPDIDSYNEIFSSDCDQNSEKDIDSDETDIEEELVISETVKTRTDEEDTLIEINDSSGSGNGNLKDRKCSLSDSSGNDVKHTSVLCEECDASASNQSLEHNIQTELTYILSEEEASAESLATLVAEQHRVEAKLRQEEEDRQLAVTLQREFNQQMRKVNRSRGSEDEYILRKRRPSVSTSGKAIGSQSKKSSYHTKARQPTLRESIAKRHRTT